MARNSIIAREIARNIVLAQISSNRGKGDWEWGEEVHNSARCFGYSTKDKYILNALNLIAHNKPTGFTFWVVRTPDQNGYPSILCYFEHPAFGQCSFHSPAVKSEGYNPFISKGHPTKWDKEIGGSREFCKKLIRAFSLEEKSL